MSGPRVGVLPQAPRDSDWVYPIYVVHTAADAVKNPDLDPTMVGAVEEILDDLRSRPEIADSIHVGAVVHESAGFVRRSLSQVLDPTPRRAAGRLYISAYAALYQSLEGIVERDRAAVSARGARWYRPLIVLVLDTPADSFDRWREAHRQVVVDADLAELGEEVAQAVIVTVCLSEPAESTASAMAYPPELSMGYRVDDLDRLRIALRGLVAYAAGRLQSVAAGTSATLLPPVTELPPWLRPLPAGSRVVTSGAVGADGAVA